MLKFTSYILFFSLLVACNNPQQGSAGNDASNDTASSASGNTGLNIVHVKADSLQAGYTALSKELERLDENIAKAQENLTREGNALQAEINRLQNKAQQGLLSPNQIQSEQQRIAQKEQEIMQKREIALNSIQQEQLVLQSKFAERVKAILEDLQAENGYDYILNQAPGSAVLISNDTYDITDIVLERLNAAGDNLMDEPAETEQ